MRPLFATGSWSFSNHCRVVRRGLFWQSVSLIFEWGPKKANNRLFETCDMEQSLVSNKKVDYLYHGLFSLKCCIVCLALEQIAVPRWKSSSLLLWVTTTEAFNNPLLPTTLLLRVSC